MIQFANNTGLILLAVVVPVWLVGAVIYRSKQQGGQKKSHLVERVLKTLILVCLCLAISEPYIEKVQDKSEAVVLLDISDSMDEGVGESLLDRALEFASDSLTLHVIPFAGEPAPVRLTKREGSSYRKVKTTWSKLDIGSTSLEAALERVFSSRHLSILLVSDGYETSDDLNRIVPSISQGGTKIFPLVPEGSVDTEKKRLC